MEDAQRSLKWGPVREHLWLAETEPSLKEAAVPFIHESPLLVNPAQSCWIYYWGDFNNMPVIFLCSFVVWNDIMDDMNAAKLKCWQHGDTWWYTHEKTWWVWNPRYGRGFWIHCVVNVKLYHYSAVLVSVRYCISFSGQIQHPMGHLAPRQFDDC